MTVQGRRVELTSSTFWLAALSVLVIALPSEVANAEERIIGAEEYRISCQVCHGVEGRGDGPMTKVLTVKPSDLTQISKKNGGTFPLLKVMHIVDGRPLISAHGDGRSMPIWGARYKAEQGGKYGPYGGEMAVRARILELVFYIQSIQQN